MALNTANFMQIGHTIHKYVTTDTLATAVANNYFANKDLIYRLAVGDTILIIASDVSSIVHIKTVDVAAMTCTIDRFRVPAITT